MKRNSFFLLVVSLLFIFTNLYAFDWNNEDLQDKEKITVVHITNINGSKSVVLEDSKQHQFTVTYKKEFNLSRALDILELKNTFFSFANIKVKDINFIINKAGIDVILLPSSVIVNNTNIIKYIPSGLFFLYNKNKELQYNFRMTKDNLFMRIKGYFLGEDKLIAKIQEALQNPSAYIKKRDPEYFLSKLEQLESKLDKLEKENSMLKWAVITLINDDIIPRKAIEEVIRIKKKHPEYGKKKIAKELDKKDIDISKSEVNIILTVYFNEFDD